jgi:hypothetical protein
VLAVAPLFFATLGACLSGLAPTIGPDPHHLGMRTQTNNDTCMGCHEAEQAVLDQLAVMPAAQREVAMGRRMAGGGASLVAQWMLDDERSCAACHLSPRGAR